ncbi:MAG: LuxR C-terminal-related transcriptional regulator [Patescibacteria group bacterium]
MERKRYRPTLGKRLSKREIEVINLFWQGYSSKETADVLFMSKRTVDSYALNAYAKLGGRGRLDACVKAVRLGVITVPEQTKHTPDGRREVLLTKCQKGVLELVASGLSRKEVARILKIETTTVGFHLYNIAERLQTINCVQAVRTAIRLGLISGNALTQKDFTE